MSEQKRKHPRVGAKMSAQFKMNNAAAAEKKAEVCNVSRGGICLSLEGVDPAVGETLAFMLGFSHAGPISPIMGIGEIKWTKKNDSGILIVGVEFKSMDLASAERIAQYIRDRQPVDPVD